MGHLDESTNRIVSKVGPYREFLGRMLADVWSRGEPIEWHHVGAGNGQIVEAITKIAAEGSRIGGLVPMEAKASEA